MSYYYDAIILGAGINGVAVARALAKVGRSVCTASDPIDCCIFMAESSPPLIHCQKMF